MSQGSGFPVEAVCAHCARPIRREQSGGWQLEVPARERIAAFKARHPEVAISENGRSAAWFDDDGSHTVSYESSLRMIGYLEARFDR